MYPSVIIVGHCCKNFFQLLGLRYDTRCVLVTGAEVASASSRKPPPRTVPTGVDLVPTGAMRRDVIECAAVLQCTA